MNKKLAISVLLGLMLNCISYAFSAELTQVDIAYKNKDGKKDYTAIKINNIDKTPYLSVDAVCKFFNIKCFYSYLKESVTLQKRKIIAMFSGYTQFIIDKRRAKKIPNAPIIIMDSFYISAEGFAKILREIFECQVTYDNEKGVLTVLEDIPYDSSGLPQSKGNIIQPEDVLIVSIYGQENLSRESVVQTNGKLKFPFLGEIQAAGFTTNELEKNLVRLLAPYVKDARISITIKTGKSDFVKLNILGQVQKPGSYEFSRETKVLDAVLAAGGATDLADTIHVKIFRGSGDAQEIISADVEEIMKTGNSYENEIIMDNDIIIVPLKKGIKGFDARKIYVLGEVKSPGAYSFKEGSTLLELILTAGGLTENAGGTIRIVRTASPEQIINVDAGELLERGKNNKQVMLKAGDHIYISKSTWSSFSTFIKDITPFVLFISAIVGIIYLIKVF